jgi:hypothetical protein
MSAFGGKADMALFHSIPLDFFPPCTIDESCGDQPDKLLLSCRFSKHFGLRYGGSVLAERSST